ncbi:hypothetical protein WR25_24061 [Diploscapter pachys]|uniref:Integrase catalytic domain-containing protein n=1 Tax=Diploscapter pachys TaxID=2018661 RepID=A0A2A2L9X5_9BILA|nr:hypothetical protein WR25_24061 [Diploscapter pachys]
MIPIASYAYNASKNAVTKFTPFLLMFGREPELTLDRALRTPHTALDGKKPDVKRAVGAHFDVDTSNAEIRKVICQTHKIAAERTDRAAKRTMETTNMALPEQANRPLRPGNLIYEKENSTTTKLEPKWKGPFPVLEAQTPNVTI